MRHFFIPARKKVFKIFVSVNSTYVILYMCNFVTHEKDRGSEKKRGKVEGKKRGDGEEERGRKKFYKLV